MQHRFRGIAQLVEQRSPKPRAVSSRLTTPATNLRSSRSGGFVFCVNILPQSSLRDASPLWDGAFVPLQRGSLMEGAGCECSEQTEEVRLFHLFCGFFVFSA